MDTNMITIIIIALLAAVVLLSGARLFVKRKETTVEVDSNGSKENMGLGLSRLWLSRRAYKNEQEKRAFELEKIRLEQELKILEDEMKMKHEYLMHTKTLEYASKGVKIQNGQTQAEPSATRPLLSRNILRMDEYGKSSSAT